MDVERVLALYDEEQRREIEYPSMRREATPEVIRHTDLNGNGGVVLYSWLTPDNAERVIREQVAYFGGIGHEFEWKAYSHDAPEDLVARLALLGFEVEEREAIMALELASAPPFLFEPVTADTQRITDPAHIHRVIAVLEEVWQEEKSGLGERLANDLRNHPDDLSVYIAYGDYRAASAAWIYFHEKSQFASLWGGSTLPAYRKQGLYSALLAVRAQEARRRGVRFLTVDASPMSRPILEKLGFHLLTYAHACVWKPQ